MLAGDPLARRVAPGILAAGAATRLRPRWCRGRGSGEPAQGTPTATDLAALGACSSVAYRDNHCDDHFGSRGGMGWYGEDGGNEKTGRQAGCDWTQRDKAGVRSPTWGQGLFGGSVTSRPARKWRCACPGRYCDLYCNRGDTGRQQRVMPDMRRCHFPQQNAVCGTEHHGATRVSHGSHP